MDNTITIRGNTGTYLIPAYDGIFRKNAGYVDAQVKGLDSFFKCVSKHWGNVRGTFLDIGANIGTTVLPALKYEPVTRVLAVEPVASCYACLEANVVANGVSDSVVLHRCAASDRKGESEMRLSASNCGDHRMVGTQDRLQFGGQRVATIMARRPRRKVPTDTIDNILKECGVDDPAFLWVDVQGWETHALAGAEETLAKGIPTVIEFWPNCLDAPEELFGILQRHFTHFINQPDQRVQPVGDLQNAFDSLLQKSKSMRNASYHGDLFLIRN